MRRRRVGTIVDSGRQTVGEGLLAGPLTPAEMFAPGRPGTRLSRPPGARGGRYMTDRAAEFPADWFKKRQALPGASRPGAEPLRHGRLAAALGVAREGVDLSRGPAGLVPMVLPLLHGPALGR